MEFASRQLEFEFLLQKIVAPESGQNSGASLGAITLCPSSDPREHARPLGAEQGTTPCPEDWFAAVRAAGLPVTATSVARILRDHLGLSIEDLADATGLSVRGVRKGVRRLEYEGFADTRLGGGRAAGGGGRRNAYRLTVPGGAP